MILFFSLVNFLIWINFEKYTLLASFFLNNISTRFLGKYQSLSLITTLWETRRRRKQNSVVYSLPVNTMVNFLSNILQRAIFAHNIILLSILYNPRREKPILKNKEKVTNIHTIMLNKKKLNQLLLMSMIVILRMKILLSQLIIP